MKVRRPYAVVDIRWLPLTGSLKYPATPNFGLTGFRGTDGPEGVFSVYVKMQEGKPTEGMVQSAKLYAIVDAMADRLPEVGMTFLLTSGETVVAECSTRERGEELQ